MRRSKIGGVAYVGLAATLFVAPVLVSRPWRPAEAGPSVPDGSVAPRFADRIGKVEVWASEGFSGLAAEVSSRAEPPKWEEVRRLMERRGCAELAYVINIHYLCGDEEVFDQTLVRHPYREPQHAPEFLRYLRGGPEAAFGADVGPPPGTVAKGDADAPATAR